MKKDYIEYPRIFFFLHFALFILPFSMVHKLPKFLSDAKLFYAHAGFFAFSEIIFLLSLPVLFLEQGFSLSFIFLFYGFASLPGYFFTVKVMHWIMRTNIRYVMAWGVVLYILLGCVSFLITAGTWWWMVALLLLGLQALVYWPARHLYFVEIAHKERVGLQAGILNAVIIIARMSAPILSGFVALLFQVEGVLLFGALTMLFSVVPILLIRTRVQAAFDVAAFQKMREEHAIFTTTRSVYIADGMNSILSYLLWPMLFFLFLSNNSYFELGSLMTVSYAISAGIMIFVGHLFDRQRRKAVLGTSIVAHVTASLGRFALLFFHPVTFVYAVQSLYSFSESALQSAFEAYWYSYGKITNSAFFTIHREIHFALGRFALCVVLAILAAIVSDAEQLWYVFLLSIPVVIVYWQKRKIDGYLQ